MNLIPVSEIIELAKKRGINLGKGTPQNRIAYFVKLGLIPHAIRKTNPKTGKIEAHFPESILSQIEDINHLKRKNTSVYQLRSSFAPSVQDTPVKHYLNLRFVVAGFAVLLIMLFYTNFILSLAAPQPKVLGVSDFVAPLSQELSPLLSPVGRFISNIGNSVRLGIGTFLVSLLPMDLIQTRVQTETSENTIVQNLDIPSSLVLSSLTVDNNQTIGGTLTVTGKVTLNNDLLVEKNITLTGVINSTRITDNKLLFGGDSPSIYAGTTNTGISLNANGTGAISIGNSSKGDIYLGGGDTAGTRCMVTNASGNLTCSGDITLGGGDILSNSSTLRIGTSSNTVNIAGTLTVGTSTTTITGTTVSSGQLSLTREPTLVHTGTWAIGSSTWNESDATIYVNPASATADSNIFALSVGGSVKFDVDAEGDVYANNIITAGSVTSATTTVGTLNVEGNTTLGDATTDTLTVNTATLTWAGGNKTIDLTGAATRTLTLLNSTASQVADLDLSDGIYKIGGVTGKTVSACGVSQYLGGVAVTGGIVTALGTCTTVSSKWSGLTDPDANLSLSMGTYTTALNFSATSGDVLAVTDTSLAAASANLANFTFKNNNTGAGVELSGVTITEQAAATPSSGTNTSNLLNLSAAAGGTVNGINISSATGFTNFIKTPTFNLDSSGNITGVVGLTATNLTGTIQTGSQTNITAVGTLTSLVVTGNVNSTTGSLQTNSITRIDNSGNLTAVAGTFSGAVSGITTLSIGTNPASAGEIRLPNAGAIRWRNAANNANIGPITVDSNNEIVIRDDGGGNPTLAVGSQYIKVGRDIGVVASSGLIRLPNAATISQRNAGNTADDQIWPLQTASNCITSNPSLTPANTWIDGPSISLGVGTWYVSGQVLLSSSGSNSRNARLWDGTTNYATAQAAAGSYNASLPLSAIITLTTTTTIKISATTDGASGQILGSIANPAVTGDGLASCVRAMKIGN